MMECTLTFSFAPLSLKIHLDVEGGYGSWTDWEDSCSSPCGPGNLGRVENIISISIIKSAAKIPNSGKIMSTRSCAPEGSCMGDFHRMTRTPCQEDLLHIGDNGDLVEAPEGQTCPNGDFGEDGHCLCQKGERVTRLETLFNETSTDRILILHCQQLSLIHI